MNYAAEQRTKAMAYLAEARQRPLADHEYGGRGILWVDVRRSRGALEVWLCRRGGPVIETSSLLVRIGRGRRFFRPRAVRDWLRPRPLSTEGC